MLKVKFLLIICLLLSSFAGNAQFLSCITSYDKSINSQRIEEAYQFAKLAHQSQIRKLEGVPYITHPERVAKNIYDVTRNEDMVVASLLHDTIEDSGVLLDDIEALFGKRVAGLVDELTTDPVKLEKLGKNLYLKEKLQLMSSDALTIKLYDRLDNLSDLHLAEASWAHSYSIQTFEIVNNLNRELTPVQRAVISEIKMKIAPYIFK